MTKKKLPKRRNKIVLTILFLILVLFFALLKTSQQSYSSNKVNLSFNYPQNWRVSVHDTNELNAYGFVEYIQLLPNKCYIYNNDCSQGSEPVAYIQVEPANGRTIEEYKNTLMDFKLSSKDSVSLNPTTKDVRIGNKNGFEFTITSNLTLSDRDTSQTKAIQRSYFLIDKNLLYTIHFFNDYFNATPESSKIINNIVSSFRFN